MAQTLVSVIIPTFKRQFVILEKALRSVIAQTYKNIEIIVVDDSPNDYPYREDIKRNIELLNDRRIRYFQHEQNMGACAARNTGIQYSKGEYLAFLDDDDEWLPNKLEKQLRKAEDTGASLIYCSSYIIKIKMHNIKSKRIKKTKKKSGYIFDDLILDNFIGSTSYVLVEKLALIRCHSFDIQMKASQDYDLWLRIAKKYKVDYVDLPLVKYYLHEDERISMNMNSKIQGTLRIIEKNIDYLKAHPKAMSNKLLTIMIFYIEKKEFIHAMQKFNEAIKIYPKNILSLRIFARAIFVVLGIYNF